MSQNFEYNSWLTEDLEQYHKDLINERSRCEMYSDRVELNKIIRIVLEEIQSRKKGIHNG